MTVIRLIGGLTPGDASDPRTFPEIFNAAADVIDASEAGLSVVEGDVGALQGEVGTLQDDVVAVEGDVVGLKDGSLLPGATPFVAGVVLGTTSDATNTALGNLAFQSKTTGTLNTAVGRGALRDNTTGNENTAFGQGALANNVDGFRNTAVGALAGRDITAGDNNLALGRAALLNNTTGSANVAVGRASLFILLSGSNNTAVGRDSLSNLTNASNNTGIGNGSTASSATVSNQITLGNSAITSLRCNVTTISSLSDVRDKTDIVDTQHGLDTLNKIRPVDFTWARRDGSFGSAPDIGFIAQELASVEDELGDAHRLRLTLRDNPEKLEATPGRLIPILVKAVQELSAKNNQLFNQNNELEARLVKLEGK